MIAWETRPEAARNLFNPAFCAALLARTVRAYNDTGMDTTLAYIALPLILHAATRASLPRNTSTTIGAWREREPELVYEFAAHASVLREFVDTAILIGLQYGFFGLNELTGKLTARGSDTREERFIQDDRFAEVSFCLERARFVGRWLARAGSASMVYAMFGVRP